LTGLAFSAEEIDECGRNITGLEHMINFRIGLRAADDTLPKRWFDEPNTFGPFKGEKIDRAEFQAMKTRFYAVTGLNSEGLPQHDWHRKLSQVATGFAVEVELPPGTPGVPDGTLIVDEPVDNVVQLRDVIARRLPEAAEQLGDRSLNIAVNDQLLVSGELTAPVRHGDRVTLLPMLGGG
jgi:aldehyde:ferredoxin oxidoreductase